MSGGTSKKTGVSMRKLNRRWWTDGINKKKQEFTEPECYNATFHKKKDGEVENSQRSPSGGTEKKKEAVCMYQCARRSKSPLAVCVQEECVAAVMSEISHQPGRVRRSNAFSKMLHSPEPEPPVEVQVQ
jgi:hypothetical protein